MKETTKNPLYAIKLAYKLAQRYCVEHAMSLSKDECEAMELVGRRIHRIENTLKKA
jgi:hypothetical protein